MGDSKTIEMTEKEIRISYKEYAFAELTPEDRELVDAALEAVRTAYAPYSHFHVGAAVRMSNGVIVKGSNQENAAYPSGICAERTAMFAASASYPEENLRSIALAGGIEGVLGDNPSTPCGACRQVMAQYQRKAGAPVSVLIAARDKVLKFDRVDDILPFIFDNL